MLVTLGSWALCAIAQPTRTVLSAGAPERIEIFPREVAIPGVSEEAGSSCDVEPLPDSCVPFLVPFFAPSPPPDGATTVVVLPGGAFQSLSPSETEVVGQRLQRLGYTALILHYRTPAAPGGMRYAPGVMPDAPPPREWTPLIDLQRAMAVVRANAAAWRCNPDRIGVLGFSAGGALSALYAYGAWRSEARRYAPIDGADAAAPVRPAFAALIYPSGLLIPRPGRGTERPTPSCPNDGCSLIFPNGTLQVAVEEPPPTFLAHASNDSLCSVNGTLALAEALTRAGEPPEVRIFDGPGHAFGVFECDEQENMPACGWPEMFGRFLVRVGMAV